METILAEPAWKQASLVRDRQISSQELVEAQLERIESINPTLNALIQSTAETALAEATAADSAKAAGTAGGPLHGVPFTVKDWIETAGVVCTAGFEERAGFVPRRDATVVRRMRDAGAILLGKTNVSETNPVYGATYNPYDTSRSAGASSSGEAALIAAGSAIGLASDSGGSLRLPAHYCGVATLRPTTGRVPLTGRFPRISAMLDPRTQIGPMARSVKDLSLALPLITGIDGVDAGAVPVPLQNPEHVDLRALRVAYFVEFDGATPDDDTRLTLADVVAALAEDRIVAEEAALPRIEESLAITRVYWNRSHPSNWTEWDAQDGSELSGTAVDRGLFDWDRLRRAMLRFLRDFDVVICPVAERAAGPHGSVDAQSYIYTLPFSLTGWPVAVVRAGTASDGMPIGVQVAAGPWRDDTALALASRVETLLGGWQAPAI